MELLSATLDVLGVIFVAYAALRVHHRVLAEHQIDNKVFKSMKREQVIGVVGVLFIVTAYLMELTTLL